MTTYPRCIFLMWGKLGEFYGAPTSYVYIVSLLAGSWKGCRIMCVGDYMQTCPPDVLTPAELTKIKDLPDVVSKSKTLYMLAVETYTKISSWDQYDLCGTVLRNWTKHIYVRRDVVVEELARYRGDISHVLLANICWSESGSCALNVDITRGACAGDRLDIKLLRSVEDKDGLSFQCALSIVLYQRNIALEVSLPLVSPSSDNYGSSIRFKYSEQDWQSDTECHCTLLCSVYRLWIIHVWRTCCVPAYDLSLKTPSGDGLDLFPRRLPILQSVSDDTDRRIINSDQILFDYACITL
ncbi:hypothetical protein EV421DRAFT_1927278 [Armillaria borealis]|uniref:Uncharacterized protein n=1 Tax=Armillaria borealis TaxID=47425 RepID=A0AA39MF64_9AGAR|nr:hypothetical protein EV421DRAFT_1927278 [Armillaria borealis]